MYKLLLIEDDEELREIITDYFVEKSGGSFRVDYAETGIEVEEKYMDGEYDLVLLDVMLPEVDGFTICRELRKDSDVPIIFLTARHTEEDKIHGYNIGCDDYVSKPFSLAVLYAKAMALINRAHGTVRNKLLTSGNIKVDPYRCTVHVDDCEILLAPKEYEILKLLIENKGKIVSRDSLLIKVWGYDFDGNDRVVDNHVKKLRKALGKASSQIKTVIKRGYRLEV